MCLSLFAPHFWMCSDVFRSLFLPNRLSPPPSVLPAAELRVLADPGVGCQVAGRYQVPARGSTEQQEVAIPKEQNSSEY